MASARPSGSPSRSSAVPVTHAAAVAAGAGEFGVSPECYICKGPHMMRDCPCCWQCGSSAHISADCDRFTAVAARMRQAHTEVRDLANRARIAMDVGNKVDARLQLSLLGEVLQ